MKIHRIELHNLTSFYGVHCIDFDKDLQEAPLFLISGPTGAGKSTLLDAICLALFGKTPRLDCAARQIDHDVRKVMSHGTDHCCATLDFSRWEKNQRIYYRAIWSCRKVVRTGTLQKPHRSLARLQQDDIWSELCSSNLNKVFEPIFAQVLEGFTVDDFQRSMLLAQGEFAAFLKADEDQKAAMLERLTSTQIYQHIGQSIAAIRKQKEHAIDQCLLQSQHLQLLSDEMLEQLQQEHDDLLVQHKQQLNTVLCLTVALQWQQNQKQIAIYEVQCSDLRKQIEALALQQEQGQKNQIEQQQLLSHLQNRWEEMRPQLNALRMQKQKLRQLHEQLLQTYQRLDEVHPELQRWQRELQNIYAQTTRLLSNCVQLQQQLKTIEQNLLFIADGTLSVKEQRAWFQMQLQQKKDLQLLVHLRTQLQEGKACLLCGSSKHPYAHAEISQQQAFIQKQSSLQEKLEQWEFVVQQWEQGEFALHQIQQEQQQQKLTVASFAFSVQHILQSKKNAEEQITHLQAEYCKQAEQWNHHLSHLEIDSTLRHCSEEELLDRYEEKFMQQIQQQQKIWQESLSCSEEQRRSFVQSQTKLDSIELLLHKERQQVQQRSPEIQMLCAEPITELQKQIAEGQERSHSLLLRCGALQQQLQEQNRARTQQKRLQQQLQEARQEYAIWQHLGDFIGDEKGLKFKRMVQIFNLQGLMLRANQRLQDLAPRYQLVEAKDEKGLPRLSFSISDAYLAGAVRAITTLSGGETFLVSLALALALADYRSQQMPIETLLLDEGFGTLDGDTLQIVMDALERLQGGDVQIGIISHVQALNERIPTRILVAKGSNGHASLHVQS